MLTLLRTVECYAPEPQGIIDILIGGGRIIATAPKLDLNLSGVELEIVDGGDSLVIPGLVDTLVHIVGGGGEGGFASRTPELPLSAAIRSGITTMIGALGTDSVTRTLSNLLAKARELQQGGIRCFCHTGSYHLPAKTLTGSVESDIVFIPEFIGVGEVAISDHRSSQPSTQQLASLAAEARVAGMIAGKSGIVSVHVGDGGQCLEPLWEVARQTDLPLTQFYPTHINRNPELFSAGITFAKAGGVIDLTTSTTPELL
ncbi:MAG: beta-aspartyl-peptidase, partial [Oleiphilaceae bacterium]|nr:beta-aspartyl-peptidase [Oleiphilaceae bacterium]